MFGYSSTLDKSMNGVKTLTDGISIISDGIAQHENIIYSDYVKSQDGLTEIINDTVTTINVDAENITGENITGTDLSTDTINCNYLYVNDLSNPLQDVLDVNGETKKMTMNGTTDFKNTVNVINTNVSQTQGGTIQQAGTNFNTLKDTKINGYLEVGSNLTQTGGSTVLMDITCDNITQNSGKGITQSGNSISNNFGGTTYVKNLTILDSVSFPSNVTIPGTTTNDDIIMEEDSVITQAITYPTDKFNSFRDTKTLDLDVDGNFTQTKSGASATLKNTTIQGTCKLQGDIEQTAGATKLNTIESNNITLRANNDLNISGTGKISQSGTGSNTMNAITLNNNQNITFNGSGIISQPTVNGINVLSHFRGDGFGIIAGRNNTTTYSNSQPIQNYNGLQFQYNRDNSSFYSHIMTNRGTGGNGGFRFQRYGNGNGTFIDEPLVIDDNITMNKNLQIPAGSLTCSSATIGSISQTELNCLDNCSVNIQTELNLLSTEIDNLQTSTTGNATALTGISYAAGTDTTTVDNNLTISAGKNLLLGTVNIGSTLSGISYTAGTDTTTIDNNLTVGAGKNLLVGTANVMNLINLNANDIIALNQRTSGMSYSATPDRTTIDNNVTINKTLIVQGMDIKAEIDTLDATITSGTLDTNNLAANNLTVELDTRLGNNGGHTYFKGPAYFCDIVDGDETQYTDVVQNNNVLTIDNSVANSEIVFNVKNSTTSIEALRIKPTSIVASNSLLVEKLLTVENKSYLKDDITVYKNLFLPNGLSLGATNFITGNVNLGYYMEEYNVLQVDGINPVVTLPALIGTNTNYLVVSFVLISKTSTMTIRPQQSPLKKLYDVNRNEILSFVLTPTTYTSVRLMYYEPNNNWYVLDFQRTPDSVITTTLTATTANITTANVTTLNTTGTSSFNTTNITTSNGLTSSGSVTINDNGGSTTRTLAVIPNSNSGSFNPTVQSGDISIVGMGTANGENGNFNISSWSNTRNGCRITNNSTTVSGGDNNIHVNSTNGVTIQSTKTQIKGKLISRNITAGYMVNGNVDIGTEFYPIICSTRKFRPANVDDYYIVNPGYKFTIYRNDDYTESAGVEYIYNVANTTDEVQIYTIPFIGKFNYDLKNRMNSIKVEYSDDGGANYTEVTLPGIS